MSFIILHFPPLVKDKRSGDWHVHNGYEHTEYSESHRDPLSSEDDELLEKVLKLWQNRS